MKTEYSSLSSFQERREYLEGVVGRRVKLDYSGPDYPYSCIGKVELVGRINSLGIAKFSFDPDDIDLKDVTLTIGDIEDVSVLE